MIGCRIWNRPQSVQRLKHIFMFGPVWSETAPYGRMLEWHSDRMLSGCTNANGQNGLLTLSALRWTGCPLDVRMHMAKMAFGIWDIHFGNEMSVRKGMRRSIYNCLRQQTKPQ